VIVDSLLGGLEDAASSAARAEAAGFDGAFTGEVASDPFLPLVAAAAATRRIEVGTSVAIALARSPMTLAYTAHDLQRFSGGRLVLGLGSQVEAHVRRRFSMPWHAPVGQLREYVLALRAIWRCWSDGEPLAFEGEHYRHTLMPPMFVPPRHEHGPPPIHLAGVGAAMTRLAGEVADGFVCHAFTTDRWVRERTLPALAEGRAMAGGTLDGLTVKATLFVVTGDEAEMQDRAAAVRAQLAFYASTPAYRPVLELHGWDDLGPELTRLSKSGRWSDMAACIDDEVLHAFAVVAPTEELPAAVAARCAGAVDRASFLGLPDDPALLAALRAIPGRAASATAS
jgi:probable F420-dependent oxidoreductase